MAEDKMGTAVSVYEQIKGKEPQDILRWAVEHYERVGCTCSFGGTGIIVAHMIGERKLPIPIYFLDTGLLFQETLDFRRAFAERYDLTVVDVHPNLSVPEQDQVFGNELYRRDPDRCCHLRKVEPMEAVLQDLDVWITGLRRDQGASRSAVDIVEEHVLPNGHVVVKLNPIAGWTKQQAWAYITEHQLPYNPLLDRGYKSIGCWPCTVPVSADADERAGRWAGTGKTECGLHTFTRKR